MSRPLAAIVALPLIAASFAMGYAALSSGPGRCGGDYRVQRGDTLYAIARRCGSSVAAIARASRLRDPRRIEIGQLLVIPGGGHAGAGPHRPVGPATVYRIAPQDTLYSLARWAGVGVGALMRANPGIDPRRIEIGDAIRLPAGARDPLAMRARERGTAMPQPAAPPRAMPGHHGPEHRALPPHPDHDMADKDDLDRAEDLEQENDEERQPQGM